MPFYPPPTPSKTVCQQAKLVLRPFLSFTGDATLFNVWDYLIIADEVKQMYLGPGTERGNAAAWVDLEKYLHGYTALRSNPVLKWKGSCVFFSIN